jgi:DNA replication and repair protein RecF
MYLKSLYLNNFRLYEEAHIEFCPGVNWISGRNAIGKTTVLEAIHLLATGSSFRTHQMSHLIRHGADYFYLEAQFVKHGIDQRLRLSYSQRERRIFINNNSCNSLSGLCGNLLCIALCPDDLSIINGAPQERRRLLDAQLSQVNPLYLHHLTRYQRAMKQRNYLLKAKSLISIESWEYEMAVSAAYLLQQRLLLATELQKHALPLHRIIAEEDLTLGYRPYGRVGISQISLQQQYIEQYQRNRPREIAMAMTLVGPHKDDMTIAIGDKEARFFASEGQQRSCAAALRLAQWQQLQHATELPPLMLVDDITANLDEARCTRLYSQFAGMSQLFLTSTHAIPEMLTKSQYRMIDPNCLACYSQE